MCALYTRVYVCHRCVHVRMCVQTDKCMCVSLDMQVSKYNCRDNHSPQLGNMPETHSSEEKVLPRSPSACTAGAGQKPRLLTWRWLQPQLRA